MTVSQLITTLAALPPDAEVVLDIGLETFLELAVEHDEGSGVRIVLDPEDAESAEVAYAIKVMLA